MKKNVYAIEGFRAWCVWKSKKVNLISFFALFFAYPEFRKVIDYRLSSMFLGRFLRVFTFFQLYTKICTFPSGMERIVLGQVYYLNMVFPQSSLHKKLEKIFAQINRLLLELEMEVLRLSETMFGFALVQKL